LEHQDTLMWDCLLISKSKVPGGIGIYFPHFIKIGELNAQIRIFVVGWL